MNAPPPEAPGLYDRPELVIDPGMHTAMINRTDADPDGRFVVTGSDDKTVRVWSLADGALLRTIRLPAGPGDVGKLYAVKHGQRDRAKAQLPDRGFSFLSTSSGEAPGG